MSNAGTMLSDLDGSPGGGDNDFVQRILADLNTTGNGSNPVVQQPSMMPPPAGNGRIVNSPNPNTTSQLAMDPATATAHMIGKAYPTPADFATMMNQGNYSAAPQMQQQFMQQQPQPMLTQLSQGKGFLADYINQLRQPLLVAIIFCLMSLPVVNVMLGHYMPSLLRAAGDLTTLGLLVKSLAAGTLYWVILNVVAPLVNGQMN